MNGFDVEAVLREHAALGWVKNAAGNDSWGCLCGADVDLPPEHRAHVAAVLRVEIDRALADAMREAEKAVVAFLDDVPCWKAPGERAMVDCAVEDLSADVARLFAEMRGEPRPPGRRPYRPTLAATERRLR